MKQGRILLLVPLLLAVAALAATFRCVHAPGTHIPPTTDIHPRKNAVYYWKTTFRLNDKEREFLRREKVGRIYLRMFDVAAATPMAVPNATVTFASHVPEGVDIVPTVFITVEALLQTAEENKIDVLAEKMVKRITAMCSWNDIGDWNEIQLDCDWTESTRDAFYMLCKEVKKRVPDKLLSSTIRLHQLQQEAPPVDYGVLMVYNTDRFDDYTTENSILNSETVETYLNRDLGFSLPLDIALPVFQWNIIFRNNRFVRIARPFEEPDSGEEVRHEQVPASELIKTMELLNRYLHTDSARHSTILYHLDSTNIDNYSHEDIKGIYNH